jgi:two-component system response regulator AlgR
LPQGKAVSAVLSVMIIDDEAPARARLRDLLADIGEQLPNVVVAEAANGLLALEAIAQLGVAGVAVDLLLVDIRMPTMDGIELARHLTQLDNPPGIIFVTAYDNYAVHAFELNAIDYLVKPVRSQRLAMALQKVRQSRSRPAPQVLASMQQGVRTHLSCRERGRLLLIPLADILYLKAELKYVTARTASREYLLDESLTHLEDEFSARFIRLHRSALVARDAIAGFERNDSADAQMQWRVILRGIAERLPVSRRQWPLVKSYAKQGNS